MLKKKDVIAFARNLQTGEERFLDYHGCEDEITNEILDEIEKTGEYVYETDSYRNMEYVFKKNFEFEANLVFKGFVRGRSSAQAKYVTEETKDYKYPDLPESHYMFLTDFEELIKDIGNVNNISGIFTYVKRGRNYAIKMVKKATDE